MIIVTRWAGRKWAQVPIIQLTGLTHSYSKNVDKEAHSSKFLPESPPSAGRAPWNSGVIESNDGRF